MADPIMEPGTIAWTNDPPKGFVIILQYRKVKEHYGGTRRYYEAVSICDENFDLLKTPPQRRAKRKIWPGGCYPAEKWFALRQEKTDKAMKVLREDAVQVREVCRKAHG